MRHVFGPVPSRRLGFSLGVDPVPAKTCTMDCVYCELGPTTNRTVCRREYVEIGRLIEELEERLRGSPELDFVTISGSGEPTLNSGIAALIEGIKRLTDKPVAVLTNGSLLTDPEVRAELGRADVVAPSLDAVSREVFEAVNRPDPALDPAAIADGISRFVSEFAGEVWLETVFVTGINDGSGEIDLIAESVREINPDRVHVNTIVRPPAVSHARPVPNERLEEIASKLGPRAEVIAAPRVDAQRTRADDATALVVAMASRRPVTSLDVARVVGTSQADAAKMLNRLTDDGVLTVVRFGERLYYRS